MSSDVVLKVEEVSKRYAIYARPHHRLIQAFCRKRQLFREFWALRDVSLEVHKGEAVGIVGRNGGGKSTLLQIVAGTVEPTLGDVEFHGRVAALLELGSCFEPSFTGRENVYMNGMLLGLTRAEVEERFDDIAAFADIGDFMEQPVKMYSSGMFVRLAFAINAHVDADILIVDEALAVGDLEFSQKCMRFFREYKKRGTLLLVTHDMQAVTNLCDRAIWLDSSIQQEGNVGRVVKNFQSFMSHGKLPSRAGQSTSEIGDEGNSDSVFSSTAGCKSLGEGGAQITAAALYDATSGESKRLLQGGERLVFAAKVKVLEDMAQPGLELRLGDRVSNHIFTVSTGANSEGLSALPAGAETTIAIEFVFPALCSGRYGFDAVLWEGSLDEHTQHHVIDNLFTIDMASDRPMHRTGMIVVESLRITCTS